MAVLDLYPILLPYEDGLNMLGKELCFIDPGIANGCFAGILVHDHKKKHDMVLSFGA
ncbi:Hypothetical predicted protein [Olea europaea subsp. europaea]|uniref:Uncharacterized protein n=1 Tax=Olea europaea subsp. europaea TaxID=158383 RepID=A0A8S0Q7W0_OLEEU|nr:Hypothetical predicted protein [Olea europaea subsp. europaea]